MGRLELTGQEFHFIVVDSRAESRNGATYWNCTCKRCGAKKVLNGSGLVSGQTKSCGCLRRQAGARTLAAYQKSIGVNHGASHTVEYRSYRAMLRRCQNPSDESYARYGGRGIQICDRWLGERGLLNFIDDMGPRPSADHSIDRIDNDGDYAPDNCRWATKRDQANNRRSNVLLTFNGETLTLPQWSRRTGLAAHTIGNRVQNLGWSIEDALTKPLYARKSVG